MLRFGAQTEGGGGEVGVGANTGGDACGATRRAPGVEWRGRVGGASNAAEPGKAANRV